VPKGNVLVVVGEKGARQSIGQALTRRGYEATLAASGSQAVALAHTAQPDLVFLDTDSPDTDAVATCTELRAFLLSPIIILSSRGDEADIVLGLGVGADSYLTKPVPVAVLLATIEAATRRETSYRQRQCKMESLMVRDLTVDIAGCELRRNGTSIPLSPMEFRLMRVLAQNAGRVLTRDQLLNSVWEVRGDQVYSRTVDVHIGRLRRKIEDDPYHPRYIVTVAGVGYKMREGN
jgi:two-component system response regulator MtrA